MSNRKPKRKFTPEKIALFWKMWTDTEHHWSQKDIASVLQVTPSSLSSARARYGLPARDKGVSDERKAEHILRTGRGLARKGQTLEPLGSAPQPYVAPVGARFVSNTFTPGKECQYPYGHPRLPGFRFCCTTVTTPGPYCDEHRGRCYLNEEEFAEAWRLTIGKNPRNM